VVELCVMNTNVPFDGGSICYCSDLSGRLSRGGVGGGFVYLCMCVAVVVYLIYC